MAETDQTPASMRAMNMTFYHGAAEIVMHDFRSVSTEEG